MIVIAAYHNSDFISMLVVLDCTTRLKSKYCKCLTDQAFHNGLVGNDWWVRCCWDIENASWCCAELTKNKNCLFVILQNHGLQTMRVSFLNMMHIVLDIWVNTLFRKIRNNRIECGVWSVCPVLKQKNIFQLLNWNSDIQDRIMKSFSAHYSEYVLVEHILGPVCLKTQINDK